MDDDVQQAIALVAPTHHVVVAWDDEYQQWEVWEGKANWFGPLPFAWRDDLIQQASLVYTDDDPTADPQQLLDDYVAGLALGMMWMEARP